MADPANLVLADSHCHIDMPQFDAIWAKANELKLPRFGGVLASLVDYASVGWTSIAAS